MRNLIFTKQNDGWAANQNHNSSNSNHSRSSSVNSSPVTSMRNYAATTSPALSSPSSYDVASPTTTSKVAMTRNKLREIERSFESPSSRRNLNQRYGTPDGSSQREKAMTALAVSNLLHRSPSPKSITREYQGEQQRQPTPLSPAQEYTSRLASYYGSSSSLQKLLSRDSSTNSSKQQEREREREKEQEQRKPVRDDSPGNGTSNSNNIPSQNNDSPLHQSHSGRRFSEDMVNLPQTSKPHIFFPHELNKREAERHEDRDSTHSMSGRRTSAKQYAQTTINNSARRGSKGSSPFVDAKITTAATSPTTPTPTPMSEFSEHRNPTFPYQSVLSTNDDLVQPNIDRSSIVEENAMTATVASEKSEESSSHAKSEDSARSSTTSASHCSASRHHQQESLISSTSSNASSPCEGRDNHDWIDYSSSHRSTGTPDSAPKAPLRQDTFHDSLGDSALALVYSEDSSMVATSSIASSSPQHGKRQKQEATDVHSKNELLQLPNCYNFSKNKQQPNRIRHKYETPTTQEKEKVSSAVTDVEKPTVDYWNSYLEEDDDVENEEETSPTSTASSSSSPSSMRFEELVRNDSPEKVPYVDSVDTEEEDVDVDDNHEDDDDDCDDCGDFDDNDTQSSPRQQGEVCLQFDPSRRTAIVPLRNEVNSNSCDTFEVDFQARQSEINRIHEELKEKSKRIKNNKSCSNRSAQEEVNFRARKSEIERINQERRQNKLLLAKDKESYDRKLNESAQELLDPRLLPPPSQHSSQSATSKSSHRMQGQSNRLQNLHESPASSSSSSSSSIRSKKLPYLLLRIPNSAFGICFCLAGHSYMWKLVQEQHTENEFAKTVASIYFYSGFVSGMMLVLFYAIKLIRNPRWVCRELKFRGHFLLLPHMTLVWLALTEGMMVKEETSTMQGRYAIVALVFQFILSLWLQQQHRPLASTTTAQTRMTRKNRNRRHQQKQSQAEEPKSQYCWSSLGWCLCSLLAQVASLGSYPISFSLGIGVFTYLGWGLMEIFAMNSVRAASRSNGRHGDRSTRDVVQQSHPMSTLVAVGPPSLAAMVIDNYHSYISNEDDVEEIKGEEDFEERSSSVVAQALLGWALWILLICVLRVGTRFATEREEALGIQWSYLICFVCVACAAVQLATDTATDIIAILLVALASFAFLVVLCRTIYHGILCWRHLAEWDDPLFNSVYDDNDEREEDGEESFENSEQQQRMEQDSDGDVEAR